MCWVEDALSGSLLCVYVPVTMRRHISPHAPTAFLVGLLVTRLHRLGQIASLSDVEEAKCKRVETLLKATAVQNRKSSENGCNNSVLHASEICSEDRP